MPFRNRTCTSPDGLVHGVSGRGFRHLTDCVQERAWREQINGVWKNKRWRFDKPSKTITCLDCIYNQY